MLPISSKFHNLNYCKNCHCYFIWIKFECRWKMIELNWSANIMHNVWEHFKCTKSDKQTAAMCNINTSLQFYWITTRTALQQPLVTQSTTFRTGWRRIIPVTESWTAIVDTTFSLAGLLEASDGGPLNEDTSVRVAAFLFIESDANTDSDNVTEDAAELATLPLVKPLFVNACFRRSTSEPLTGTYQIQTQIQQTLRRMTYIYKQYLTHFLSTTITDHICFKFHPVF